MEIPAILILISIAIIIIVCHLDSAKSRTDLLIKLIERKDIINVLKNHGLQLVEIHSTGLRKFGLKRIDINLAYAAPINFLVPKIVYLNTDFDELFLDCVGLNKEPLHEFQFTIIE